MYSIVELGGGNLTMQTRGLARHSGGYVFLDTSRFGYRLTLLSRTLLPVPSQWFD